MNFDANVDIYDVLKIWISKMAVKHYIIGQANDHLYEHQSNVQTFLNRLIHISFFDYWTHLKKIGFGS